jgi:hypothetical protein
MSGIKNLKSHDLSGLIADVPEDAPPRLQVLGLGNTSIDDTAVPYLAACTMLRNLNLSGTRVTGPVPVVTFFCASADLRLR